MRTLWMFDNKVPGTTVTLKTQPADANIVTYGAVLQKVTAAGTFIVKKWLRSELESPAGGTAVLETAEGHNVVILPLIQPGTQPVLNTDIAFSDGDGRTQPEPLFSNEAVGWRIFMQ